MTLLHLDADALRQGLRPAAPGGHPPMREAALGRLALRRHGLRPLVIEGELLCSVTAGGEAEDVRLDLSLFECVDGVIAAAIELRLDGYERGFADAAVFDAPEAVIDWLDGFDPVNALPCLVAFDDQPSLRRLQGDLARATLATAESRKALLSIYSTLFPHAAPASATH
jgi:hypothetical protein